MQRMKMKLRMAGGIMAAFTTILAVSSMAAGQEVEKKEAVGGLAFVDEVQVTVVNIAVFVRDRQDRPVTGLTKEDFRLVQVGLARPLTHCAAYTEDVITRIMGEREALAASPTPPICDGRAAEAASRQGDIAADLVQPVYIVLYVDNENIRPFDRNRVLAQVRRFVREVMKPHVQVMVVSVQRSAKIVQPFTNDPRAVQDALRSMTQLYGARVDHDRQRGRIIHDLHAVMSDTSSGGLRNDQVAARDLEDKIRIYAEEIAMELGYSINSLREVLTTLAGLPGRKVLVHVSSGLP